MVPERSRGKGSGRRGFLPLVPLGLLLVLLLAGPARRAIEASGLFARPDAAVLRYFVFPVIALALAPAAALAAGRGSGAFPPWLPRMLPVAAIAYAAGQTALHALRLATFHGHYWDLGVFDHVLWRMAYRGEWRLALEGHVSPILWLYGALYAIWPSALFLHALQAIALAAGVVPLYRIAFRRLGRETAAGLAAAYLLLPALPCIESTGFHPDHLIIPLGLLLIDVAERRAARTFLLLSIPALLIKEVFVPSVGLLAFVVLLRWRRRAAAWGALAGSLVLFAALTALLPTAVADTSRYAPGGGPYAHLGRSPAEVLVRVIAHPGEVVRLLFTLRRLLYVTLVLSPFLFLPLLRPLEILPALPALAASLLSSYRLYYTYQFHYTAGLVPFLFWGLIRAIERVPDRWRSLRPRRGLVAACLAATVIFGVFYAPTPLGLGFWLRGYDERFYRESYAFGAEVAAIRGAIERWIPAEHGSVTTQDGIISGRIAHRARIACLNENTIEELDRFDYAVASPLRSYYNAAPTHSAFQGRARGIPPTEVLWRRIREARRTGWRRPATAPIARSDEHYVDLLLHLYDRWVVLEEGVVVIFRNPRRGGGSGRSGQRRRL